jgi:Zn-dependent protease
VDRQEWTRPPAYDPPVAEPAQPAGPFVPERPPWYKRLGSALAPVGVLLATLAGKLKLLLLALPKLKLLTTSGSMLVSIAAYSLIWGWKFAVGFVVLLFVHEMGHVIALRREGIKASAPMFIPFMGAVISSRSLGGNAAAEARVGLAGPILGSLGAAALIPIADSSGNDLWRALAFTGFFLNLFNLLPVLPLDGGRAMAAMAPWMWFAGFAGLLVLAVLFPNPIILIIVLFGAMETWRRWKERRAGAGAEGNAAYYDVPRAQRLAIAAVYLGLIALLVLGMHHTHLTRDFGDV